ncbi:tripartite tricarboxylate transporter substrate binding protein [Quisquiliibacterium transsilvanicum]|uniref:Tripartite-type tricarboxylate transporter receptor subunit TctC n=1 Tax=Quisquiliibacterium transsilvanicum TaxID=1549638 RepID=A0A7W8M9C9_9BURK|nr:tripartite tricarboxylate transporter substrate binding protein [Quisquiliibacterium transsilvanicum]MBB5272743.1 tripartite-type tricarboxylate transporter receptor subunit TctC [Quisquiliibacterium transsilvanicum]
MTRRWNRSLSKQQSNLGPNGRRHFLGAAVGAAVVGSTFGRGAFAQAYPSRPIKLVVPFPPGSTTDIPVRAMAAEAGKLLGVSIVVENRPGATATLGPVSVAQGSAADGYTVAIAPASLWRIPHMQKVSFDPMKDFTYIAGLAAYTYGVAVMVDRPWKTLAELVAHAKANPGKVTMGGVGVGGSAHIACFKLSKATGVDFLYVPFKGGAEVSGAMQGGHIDGTTDGAWSQLVQGGKARLLTAFTEQRLARYPDVPTARDLGFDVVADSPWGLCGPKGMDPAIVRTLEQAFLAARDTPKVRELMLSWDLQPLSLGSEAFTALAARMYAQEKRNLEAIDFKPT